jgi:DNA-binding IclR family transcriptional regulator
VVATINVSVQATRIDLETLRGDYLSQLRECAAQINEDLAGRRHA